ncbi:MAG: DinB family protein [Actinomycetota bacterium]
MFELVEAIEVLRATPSTMTAMLGTLSDPWVRADCGPGTWSPYDILGHLVAGDETDWIPRARIMIEHGIAKPFKPFDREVQFAESSRTMTQLLERFAELRLENLVVLETLVLDVGSLEARGIHPEFGEVRLGDMLATWTVHDLSHIAQAAESMAKRYSEDVGPWRQYLPLLDREELPSS